MNTLIKTMLKEITRVIVSSLCVYFGLTSTGCIAVDGSTACFVTESEVK